MTVESSLSLNCEIEEINLAIKDDVIENLFKQGKEEIDLMIRSLAINYNRDLLKAIKPLVKNEHMIELKKVIKILDKGMTLLPDRFTIEKVIQYYPSMFNPENINDTERIIADEEHRLASEALESKDWFKEESQFEQVT